MYLYKYLVVKKMSFRDNKALNIINVELIKVKLHLRPHDGTLHFTYSIADDVQTCEVERLF